MCMAKGARGLDGRSYRSNYRDSGHMDFGVAMDHCLNCKGAIGEPGKVYGYSGAWCMCPVNPSIMYRAPGMEVMTNAKLIEKMQETNEALSKEVLAARAMREKLELVSHLGLRYLDYDDPEVYPMVEAYDAIRKESEGARL
jgi:hypothetical protein